MPRESPGLGTPAEWLRRARSNLARTRQPKTEEIVWEDLCFDAQQAAEKALKALLLHRQIEFPLVHNIATLLTLIQNAGFVPPADVLAAADLTDYAVMTRYPSTAEQVSEGRIPGRPEVC